MSSLNQYIELFKSNHATINAAAPAALNSLRPAALTALEHFGSFPGKRSKGFEVANPEEMFAPNFGVNISRLDFPVDMARSFKCDIPNASTLLALVVNDSFRPTSTLIKNCPQGLTVESLATVARRDPQFIESYLGQLSKNSSPTAALNTLFTQDGVVIRVKAGVTIPRPVQIINIFNAAHPTLAFRRILVVMEQGAKAKLLFCDHTQASHLPYLSSSVTEIFLHEGSSLHICDMEESSPLTSRMSQVFVRQLSASEFSLTGASLSVGRTRNHFNVDILGPNCSTRLSALAIANDSQSVANASRVNHFAPHSHSDQLFKYLLNDHSHGSFTGLIYVDPKATHTAAYQSDRNILASPNARMHTAPQLEIYCDDVKCSHGAATGQLDANALFYMQTRGIPLQEARAMLMQAFMADIVDQLPFDSLRDRLRHLVQRRLSGQQASCASCASDCPSTL